MRCCGSEPLYTTKLAYTYTHTYIHTYTLMYITERRRCEIEKRTLKMKILSTKWLQELDENVNTCVPFTVNILLRGIGR